MRINNRCLSMLWKIIIILIGSFAIISQAGVFENSLNFHFLYFFTNQSNILCIIYCIFTFIKMIKENDIRKTNSYPIFKGICLTAISLTMIVAHFMLGGSFRMNDISGISITILHYFLPIMMILDWLLFDSKGQFRTSYPLVWTIFPLLYLVFINVVVNVFKVKVGMNSMYPYPFMDIDLIGIKTVLITELIMLVVFIIYGFLLFIIDYNMDVHEEIKPPKKRRK